MRSLIVVKIGESKEILNKDELNISLITFLQSESIDRQELRAVFEGQKISLMLLDQFEKIEVHKDLLFHGEISFQDLFWNRNINDNQLKEYAYKRQKYADFYFLDEFQKIIKVREDFFLLLEDDIDELVISKLWHCTEIDSFFRYSSIKDGITNEFLTKIEEIKNKHPVPMSYLLKYIKPSANKIYEFSDLKIKEPSAFFNMILTIWEALFLLPIGLVLNRNKSDE